MLEGTDEKSVFPDKGSLIRPPGKLTISTPVAPTNIFLHFTYTHVSDCSWFSDSSEQGAATARLYSGELGKEEHQNLSNQLQEEAQYFGEDYDDDGYGGDEEAVLLPGEHI